MAYTTASKDDVESEMPEAKGGMWFLREALETDALGFTVLELKPNESGMEHDHGEKNVEEIYYVEEGDVTVEVDDDTVTLTEGQAIRISPGETRLIKNQDRPARLVLVSAQIS